MDNYISINNESQIPKYQQIISCIQDAVYDKKISKGDKIPSLNQLMKEFHLSQDTVLTAYNELKARGVISSAVGKGYYVASNLANVKHKVFVLFDKLTAYKEVLYESIKDTFGKKGSLDIYFHHSNPKVFQKLIDDAIGNYTAYIIMPLEQKTCIRWLQKLPGKQLYLLDRGRNQCANNYSGVFQHFENDTYYALLNGLNRILKYKQFITVSNDHRKHLQDILLGANKFCSDNGFEFLHIKDVSGIKINKKQIYLVINDRDLVSVVQKIEKEGLSIGEDVGLISYNDTPLKQIAAGGITTISTNFEYMGKSVADMILKKQHKVIDNPSNLIIRNSL